MALGGPLKLGLDGVIGGKGLHDGVDGFIRQMQTNLFARSHHVMSTATS